MSNSLTPVSSGELLPRSFNKQEADAVERKAHNLYSRFQTSGVLFAAELRRLQDGGAHLIRGFTSFGPYVERTFEGISATNAVQISRQGNVMLILEKRSRIKLEAKDPNLPGSTGLRALSRLLKDFGEDAMLSIYDLALASGRKVTGEAVAAAARQLVEPMVPAELGEGGIEPAEDQPEEDEDGYTTEHSELLDRISEAHALLEELRDDVIDNKRIPEVEVALERILHG